MSFAECTGFLFINKHDFKIIETIMHGRPLNTLFLLVEPVLPLQTSFIPHGLRLIKKRQTQHLTSNTASQKISRKFSGCGNSPVVCFIFKICFFFFLFPSQSLIVQICSFILGVNNYLICDLGYSDLKIQRDTLYSHIIFLSLAFSLVQKELHSLLYLTHIW